MKYLFFFTVISLIFIACESTECCSFPPSTCYSYQVRQCQTDLFAEAVDENGTDAERTEQMSMWLRENDIIVHNIKVRDDSTSIVCQACDTCPAGPIYSIAVYDDVDSMDLAPLRLLNLQSLNCDLAFM